MAGEGDLGTFSAALVSPTTLTAVGDTYVRSGPPDQNAGGDTILSVQASGARRTLLFFDKPAMAAAVGSGRLLSARIELSIYSTASNWGSGRPIGVHRLLRASNEQQATWHCALDSNVHNSRPDCSGAADWDLEATNPALLPWAANATATATIVSRQSGTVSFDVTTDVASILDGSWPGQGWLIKNRDERQGGSIDFASRERGPAPRLMLQVEARPPGNGDVGPITGSVNLTVGADTYIRQAPGNQNFSRESDLLIASPCRTRALLQFDGQSMAGALRGPLVRARLLMPILKTHAN